MILERQFHLRWSVAFTIAALFVTAWAPGVRAQGGSYGGGVISPGSPPITLTGNSGGPRDASSTFGAHCRGSIAMIPDHLFSMTAQMRVRFEVTQAAGDTTIRGSTVSGSPASDGRSTSLPASPCG